MKFLICTLARETRETNKTEEEEKKKRKMVPLIWGEWVPFIREEGRNKKRRVGGGEARGRKWPALWIQLALPCRERGEGFGGEGEKRRCSTTLTNYQIERVYGKLSRGGASALLGGEVPAYEI